MEWSLTTEEERESSGAHSDGIGLVEVDGSARVEVNRVKARLGRVDDLHALALLDRQVHQTRLRLQVCVGSTALYTRLN